MGPEAVVGAGENVAADLGSWVCKHIADDGHVEFCDSQIFGADGSRHLCDFPVFTGNGHDGHHVVGPNVLSEDHAQVWRNGELRGLHPICAETHGPEYSPVGRDRRGAVRPDRSVRQAGHPQIRGRNTDHPDLVAQHHPDGGRSSIYCVCVSLALSHHRVSGCRPFRGLLCSHRLFAQNPVGYRVERCRCGNRLCARRVRVHCVHGALRGRNDGSCETRGDVNERGDDMGESYEVQVPPVLLIVFRRPELTRKMLESIRAAKPPRLYVACDGPRAGRADDEERVRAVRAIVAEYENDLHPITRYQTQNLGCGKGVSTAISWFFEHEEEGIILEDDCYPDPSFYRFCGEMLARYRNVTNVMQVAGYNAMSGACPIEADYRFSHYGWQWGWATWRRAWAQFDLTMASWPEFKKLGLHKCAAFYEDRVRVFDEMYEGRCDTWDYQWQYAMAANYGLSVVPVHSLITNVGVGLGCTHGIECGESLDLKVCIRPVSFPLRENQFVVPDPAYDRHLVHAFRTSWPIRIKQWVFALLKRWGM